MRSLFVLLLTSAALTPVHAQAQSSDLSAVEDQLAAMQAEIARLTAEVAELRAREASNQAQPDAAPASKSDAGEKASTVSWEGAPEISQEGGWSFKPRGRVQVDTAAIDAPGSVAGDGLSTEFRRVYLGVDGSLPGNFGYRVEADIASSSVELTDVYLTYDASDALSFTLGHHKTFSGLEDTTSDLFTSMLERAAFNSAFGFERRVGFSGEYAANDFVVQLGVFTDDAEALGDDGNDSFSLDGRALFSPKIGNAQLHIGGSAHFRELNDGAATVRYRARPFVHTTDTRLVDTGSIAATGERNFGLEFAYINGPLHATVEGHSMTARRPGLPDPTFRGGYAEVGMLITPGDKTGYRNGAFNRIRPVNPVGEGGIGAIQINARYDRLDLSDEGIVGGRQQALGLSAIWVPTDYVRFLVNYGHLWIDDAAVLAGADSDYQVDAFGVRAQVDF